MNLEKIVKIKELLDKLMIELFDVIDFSIRNDENKIKLLRNSFEGVDNWPKILKKNFEIRLEYQSELIKFISLRIKTYELFMEKIASIKENHNKINDYEDWYPTEYLDERNLIMHICLFLKIDDKATVDLLKISNEFIEIEEYLESEL